MPAIDGKKSAMPNGHGGYVRFLSVIILLVMLAAMLALYRKAGNSWMLYAGYGLAALLGERFAHHLHRWKTEEYDGGYYSDSEKTRVRTVYLAGAILYAAAAVAAWHFFAA
jgi:hypothetical protein